MIDYNVEVTSMSLTLHASFYAKYSKIASYPTNSYLLNIHVTNQVNSMVTNPININAAVDSSIGRDTRYYNEVSFVVPG
jgi:hypothetical protein